MKNLSIIIAVLIVMFCIFLFANKTEVLAIDNRTSMYLDEPCNMKTITKNLRVAGWVMSTEDIKIKMYINDTYIRDLERNDTRKDVLSKITGYGDYRKNPYPGFDYTIDVSNYISGTYNLRIEVLNKRTLEKIGQMETNFVKKPSLTTSYSDSLHYNPIVTDNNLLVEGWIMSETDIKVNLYIDNTFIKEIDRDKQRDDVLRAIKDYGTKIENPTPGYCTNLDISDLEEGIHEVKLEVLQKESNEIIYNDIETFIKDEAQMYLDVPHNIDNNITDKLRVAGWVMSKSNIKINAYIDNEFIQELTRNSIRDDVLNAIHGYGTKMENPKPGFDHTIDLVKYKSGIHVLKIEVINENTDIVLEEINKEFKISLPKTTGYIDSPNLGQLFKENKNVIFEGWVMSETDVLLKVYINNNFIEEIERKQTRDDVLRAIIGYGTKTENPTPGFKIDLDMSTYNNGKNDIKLEIISKNKNEILKTLKTSIYLQEDNTIINGIDISNHQGDINWKKVKNDGIDFAIIRAGFRGYGQAGSMNKDERFDYNIKNALANNIDVGIYFFSQATTIEEATEEANYTLNIIKNYKDKITYPVIIDVEYANSEHTGRADNLTAEQRTNIVKKYCNIIKDAGYIPMFYTDKWFATNNLIMSELTDYEYWLAHYTGATKEDPLAKMSNYEGKYSIWQYTSSGTVDGIETNVDLDIAIYKYKK